MDSTASVAGSGLLERGGHYAVLDAAHTAVLSERRGGLVLVRGEAGSGKTSLVRSWTTESPADNAVRWGACEPLFAPRPLGPIADIAEQVGGELKQLAEGGAKPYQLAAAIVAAAQSAPGIVFVLEDLHWADEATFDVVSMLGRRIGSVPALVIATYRDDELDRLHPLWRIVGELRNSDLVRRLVTEPLSPAAVAVLAGPYGVDPVGLHHATGGNPFFVTEVLAARGTIPATVREAVRARAARLSRAATEVMEAVSVTLPHAELWLLDAMAPNSAAGLEGCLDAGVLKEVVGAVAFRHELARATIEESLSGYRRLSLHRRALEALAKPPTGRPDLARLAHHAEAAGDCQAVLHYAPAAAQYASSIGAHREAATQYSRALRAGGDLPTRPRAELLESLSYECYLTEQSDASITAMQQAVACWREVGDLSREASGLSTLSRRLWCAGENEAAWTAVRSALTLLDQGPPGRELALVYSDLGQLAMNDERLQETAAWTARALELAEAFDIPEVSAHSLNTIGTVRLLAGQPEGIEDLARSLAIAERGGLEEHIGRAFINAGWAITRSRSYHLAPWLDRGVEVCADLGLDAWRLYMLAYRARYRLDVGDWEGAADDAGQVLRLAESVLLLRLLALTVLGLLEVRRGGPHARRHLDDALALTADQPELQYLAPVAAARAEAAYLAGALHEVEQETSAVLATAAERGASWVVGELLWLRRLAGVPDPSDVLSPVTDLDCGSDQGQEADGPHLARLAGRPYLAQLAGDSVAASGTWRRLRCNYDAALALVSSSDEVELRAALNDLQALGAGPLARIVKRRLRELGARGVSRGPRPRTRENGANLTGREAEVLGLLEHGASNAEIASQLYLSERTVHHHVSSILRKLSVDSRGKAASEAVRRGLTTAQNGHPSGPM